MKTLFFLSIVFSQVALAESYQIAGSLHEFKEKEGLLTKGCEKGCDALKAVAAHKSIDLEKIRQGQKYINSVGSDVCASVYKASSVLGRAQNQDGRAFCVFNDESMIEMNSLSKYLTDKKIAK